MICPGREHANREGRRYCAELAVALELSFSSRRSVNEPGEKACGECAASLVSIPVPQPVSAPSLPLPAKPTSSANGRYQVKRFLGEGDNKKVYQANNTLLESETAVSSELGMRALMELVLSWRDILKA